MSSVKQDHLQEAAERLLDLQHSAETQASDVDPRAWREWLSDTEKGAAFDEIAATLLAVKACAQPGTPSEADCAVDRFDGAVSIEEWRNRETSAHPGRAIRYLALAAAVSAVAVGAAFMERLLSDHSGNHVELFETLAGEQRQIHLTDGSTITLGARTALTTHYTDDRRTVVLDRGEALFIVARSSSRPFIVLAGSGSIRALGTAFNVLRNTDRIVVTVSEGAVEVAPRSTSSNSRQWLAARVTSGEGMTYEESGKASAVQHADPKRATAWREGRLQYLNEPLRHVIADVNRYSRRQVIYDQQAGELLYTGDVLQDRIEAWVKSLPDIFPVQLVNTDAEHVLVRAGP